ncbi:hypothetical protein MHK_010755 [Candidatus Magnetomorum sp. HK-1]|nr:hypothetical protein MHK_010755 [Candidatus Magnetomorum sp. HK-1]
MKKIFTKKTKVLRSKAIATTFDHFQNISMDQVISWCTHELKWAMARILFLLYGVIGMLTFGLSTYLTAPIGSKLFFGTWAFWPYLKYYHRIVIQSYSVLWMMCKDFEYKFIFAIPLTSAPRRGPDRNNITLSGNWVHEENTCFGCVRCCDKISCPLLNKKEGICVGYDSFYWNYFLCGRYPFTQQQIDYYNCEKWKIKYEPMN